MAQTSPKKRKRKIFISAKKYQFSAFPFPFFKDSHKRSLNDSARGLSDFFEDQTEVRQVCMLSLLLCVILIAQKNIKNRLSKALAYLRPVSRSSVYSIRTKLNLYNSIIKSVLLYGSECWQVVESDCVVIRRSQLQQSKSVVSVGSDLNAEDFFQ